MPARAGHAGVKAAARTAAGAAAKLPGGITRIRFEGVYGPGKPRHPRFWRRIGARKRAPRECAALSAAGRRPGRSPRWRPGARRRRPRSRADSSRTSGARAVPLRAEELRGRGVHVGDGQLAARHLPAAGRTRRPASRAADRLPRTARRACATAASARSSAVHRDGLVTGDQAEEGLDGAQLAAQRTRQVRQEQCRRICSSHLARTTSLNRVSLSLKWLYTVNGHPRPRWRWHPCSCPRSPAAETAACRLRGWRRASPDPWGDRERRAS